MTWEPRPVPDVTPETEPYWTGAAEGRLRLRRCNDCGLVFHYPRALCPDCFAEDVDWIDAAGTGEVYTYSTAYTMRGWPEEDLPLVVGYVELDEGPRMVTVVDAEPDEVEIGTAVRATFVPTERGDVAVPVFEPVE